jgi:hypothetical protein
VDPELDSAQNPRPAASAPSTEQASAPESEGANDGDHTAMNLIADKLLAEELAAESPEKGLKTQSKTYKHPMAIDLLLAVGLLFAMAGLTVSFVKTYITHSAKTSILQGNYKAAIGILHGSPIPEFFGGAGTDNSEDLLNQALYLDAMEKLDNNRDDQTALQELSKVSQGSFYFELAQDQFRKLKMHETDAQTQSNQAIAPEPPSSPPPAAGGAADKPATQQTTPQQPAPAQK